MKFRLFRPPCIALLELSGTLGGEVRPREWISLLEGLAKTKAIRGVVVELDSPGGSAPSADLFYQVLRRLAQSKPVVAFIRGLGTSGAYLVACGATKIVSLPTALVGSIGVLSLRPIAAELLSRLGIKLQVVKQGEFKDMGAFWRDYTPEELKKEEALVSEIYEDFLEKVAQARNLPLKKAKSYATGEVFTGRKAKELGLVDELGDLEDALELASKLARIPKRVMRIRPRRPWLQRFIFGLADRIAVSIEGRLMRELYPRI
jgi:protease-4